MATTNQMEKVLTELDTIYAWTFGKNYWKEPRLSYHAGTKHFVVGFPVPEELMDGEEFPKDGNGASFYGASFRTTNFDEVRYLTNWLKGIEKLQPIKFLTAEPKKGKESTFPIVYDL